MQALVPGLILLLVGSVAQIWKTDIVLYNRGFYELLELGLNAYVLCCGVPCSMVAPMEGKRTGYKALMNDIWITTRLFRQLPRECTQHAFNAQTFPACYNGPHGFHVLKNSFHLPWKRFFRPSVPVNEKQKRSCEKGRMRQVCRRN